MFVTSVLIEESLYSIDTSFRIIKKKKVSNSNKSIVITNVVVKNDSHKNNKFVLSPNGFIKTFWDALGLFVTLALFIDTFFQHSVSNKQTQNLSMITHLIAQFADLYFIIDIILRFNTGYIDEVSNKIVYDLAKIRYRYLRTWFLFDVILSLPYGYIRKSLEDRPAIKLLALREKSYKTAIKFMISRNFRKEVFQTFREHLKEKRWIKTFYDTVIINNRMISNSQFVNQTSQTSVIRKSGTTIRKFTRVSIDWFRRLGNYKILKYYSMIAKYLISLAMSLRTISLLSSSRRKL